MGKRERPLLIIFYRNPRIGKVKTRLAATVGEEKALRIFEKLSLHIKDISHGLKTDKVVYYSDAVANVDIWPGGTYLKALQHGDDLGERMKNAFSEGFESGYSSVCLIGTDCYELTGAVIEKAFQELRSADAVIGPAKDGGYYLIGLNRLDAEIFENKKWSTETVFKDTVDTFRALGLRHVNLPVLRDVDTEEDLPNELRL